MLRATNEKSKTKGIGANRKPRGLYARAARELEVSRSHLSRVVRGVRQSKSLLVRFQELITHN